MIGTRQTDGDDSWFRKLRDRQARARILIRINRLSLGNPGDVRPLGGGVSELRIDHGPGWRVHARFVDGDTAVLLTGGDKSTQQRDIDRARARASAGSGERSGQMNESASRTGARTRPWDAADYLENLDDVVAYPRRRNAPGLIASLKGLAVIPIRTGRFPIERARVGGRLQRVRLRDP